MSIDRNSAYNKQVEAYFEDHQDHEVFDLLGAVFSLPRVQ